MSVLLVTDLNTLPTMADDAQDANGAEIDKTVDFRQALLEVVGLTVPQVTRMANQGISESSHLSYLDDASILDCFTAALMPTTGKLIRLIAFRNWIRESHTVVGFGHVSSSHFNAEIRDSMLMKLSTGKQDGDDFRSSSKEVKEPEPWLGKTSDCPLEIMAS